MIYPTILCGGSGTRLWPSSRSSFPKQFTQLNGADSLFQQTLRRVTGDAFHPPLIVTCDGYRFTVAEQAERMGASDARIILEPDGRNTAPAILAAALTLKHEPDAVMMCMPADHKIKNIDAFHGAAELAAKFTTSGKIVTLGISPERPETGYGYMELAEPATLSTVLSVKNFVEKPDEATNDTEAIS